MTIPKKGSRKIVVENHVYRWVAAPDDGFLGVVVESSEHRGQRLFASMKYHDILTPVGPGQFQIVGQRRSITPSIVRQIILAALSNGWQPCLKGSGAFWLAAERILPVPE